MVSNRVIFVRTKRYCCPKSVPPMPQTYHHIIDSSSGQSSGMNSSAWLYRIVSLCRDGLVVVVGGCRRCSSRKWRVVASRSCHYKTTLVLAGRRACARTCCSCPTSGSACRSWATCARTNSPKHSNWSPPLHCCLSLVLFQSRSRCKALCEYAVVALS